jgi:anti-repressor protein
MIAINWVQGVPSVDARDLHRFLEVRTEFKDWILRRIADFGFSEDSDFSSFLSKSTGGRPSKEYSLSLDMAKQLSMVERTEKGKQARQYFIACEKRATEPRADISTALADPGVLRSLLLENVEKVLALETAVSELKPKAEAFSARSLLSAGGP